MYLVSACLCGVNCKYSGGNNLDEKVLQLYNRGLAIAICPEVLAGLGTPRVPHEIVGGTGEDVLEGNAKVMSKDGIDNTLAFIHGAEKTLDIAKKLNIRKAVLKAKSPSCGCGEIYDGSFTGKKIKGNGVVSELLIKNGIQVTTEKP